VDRGQGGPDTAFLPEGLRTEVAFMSHDFSLGTVDVNLSPLERFEEFLQSRGKRVTQQRRVIVDRVFSHHEHFDADQLLEQLRKQVGDQSVSRPTVYRTLSELVDAGLLRKMVLNDRSVYEHDYGYPQHDHLHCEKCDKLIEFSSDEVKEIREAVARKHNFRASGHRLIIHGVCADCSRPKRANRRLDLI
jgi:Fur family ferric uptake transcriptional regulator